MSEDTIDPLVGVVNDIRSRAPRGGRIVFVSGDFNIIHPGHLRLFNFAAECGDFLVVGVNADGMGKTIIPAEMRLESVSAIGVVGQAFILTEAPEAFITRLRPDIVVKGREHSQHFNIEEEVVEAYGGKLLFCSGDVGFSSIDLLRRELTEVVAPTIQKPSDFPARHRFTLPELIDLVRRFTELKVVIVGDLIVDEYIDCEPLGMSREDPTLVVSPLISKRFVGGAGIVAAHARGLGASVSYFSVAGDDDVRVFAEETLLSHGVDAHIIVDSTRPTTLKQRYRAGNKTLLRVSHLRQHDIDDELIERLEASMAPALADADLIVFSDFNYGCLAQPLVDRIVKRCRASGTPMVADSQASSQIGDVSRFKGMKMVTPTEHEARLAVRDFQSGLVVLADALREKADVEHVVITLAGEGILIHSPAESSGLITDRLPAFNGSPRDVSGAGDSLLTCSSMVLALGADIWRASYLGSVAAACQIRRVGNIPLTANEIIAELSA